ncbi:hypothetical protein D3C79_1007850 [compost metagenome]
MRAALTGFDALTAEVIDAAQADAQLPYAVADDYLQALALLLLGWAWSRIARTPGADTARWQQPLAALRTRVLPGLALRLALVRAQLPQA